MRRLVVILVCAVTRLAGAQPAVSDALVTRVANDAVPVRAVRVDAPLEVDRRLDEDAGAQTRGAAEPDAGGQGDTAVQVLKVQMPPDHRCASIESMARLVARRVDDARVRALTDRAARSSSSVSRRRDSGRTPAETINPFSAGRA